MNMQILNYSDLIGKPSEIGEFDLFFPGWNMTFHKLKVVKSKKGHIFVSLPSKSIKAPDGSYTFCPYISFGDEKSKDFQKSVQELLKPFVQIDPFTS